MVYCNKTNVLGLEGGRELIPMEDCVNQTRISLERSCYEEFLKTVKKDEAKNQETAASSETSRSVENIHEWKEKPLYGKFAKQV